MRDVKISVHTTHVHISLFYNNESSNMFSMPTKHAQSLHFILWRHE